MTALILVDLQKDFLPSGPLPVPEGDLVIPKVQELLKLPFDHIYASKDWHPLDHKSFAKNHKREPGEVIEISGVEQILWPVHCVQNSEGAEFIEGWDSTAVDSVIYKGVESSTDSYSAFYDNHKSRSTGLDALLEKDGVEEVYIAGLTIDYCVKYTALDSLYLGYRTVVIVDACRGVNLMAHDAEEALIEMQESGVILVTIDMLKSAR